MQTGSRATTWGQQMTPQHPFRKYLPASCWILNTFTELSSWPQMGAWDKLGHQSSSSTRLLRPPIPRSLPTTAPRPYRWRALLWRCAAMGLWCDVFALGKQSSHCEGTLRNEEACMCAHTCVSHNSPSLFFYLFHFHAWTASPFSMPTFFNAPHPCFHARLAVFLDLLHALSPFGRWSR